MESCSDSVWKFSLSVLSHRVEEIPHTEGDAHTKISIGFLKETAGGAEMYRPLQIKIIMRRNRLNPLRGLKPWQREILSYLWDDTREIPQRKVSGNGFPLLQSGQTKLSAAQEREGLSYLHSLADEDRQVCILCGISESFRKAEDNHSYFEFLADFRRLKSAKIRYGWSGEFILSKFGISYKRMYKLFKKLSDD